MANRSPNHPNGDAPSSLILVVGYSSIGRSNTTTLILKPS